MFYLNATLDSQPCSTLKYIAMEKKNAPYCCKYWETVDTDMIKKKQKKPHSFEIIIIIRLLNTTSAWNLYNLFASIVNKLQRLIFYFGTSGWEKRCQFSAFLDETDLVYIFIWVNGKVYLTLAWCYYDLESTFVWIWI